MDTPIDQKQPIFMRWYEEYRERRYLAEATDEEVMRRARDLISNLTTLEQNGKIGCLDPESQSGFFLWRLFSHLLEESRLRAGSYQALFKKYGLQEALLVKSTSPNPPASEAVLRVSQEHTQLRRIFKFGRRERMHALLDHGEVRIAPASMYNDASLASAIADDELSYDLATAVFNDDLLSLHPFQNRLIDVFGEPKSAPHRIAMRTNYYVWCTSFGLKLRLFNDFDADSVLVIRDAGEFSRRLIQAVRNPLHGWRFAPCAVHYFDPYHPSAETRNVFACKHFRYMYQEEFRYVFLPSSPQTILEPLYLTLGPLGDIAEVLDRDEAERD